MPKKIIYSEPPEYIPKKIRKAAKLGEYSTDKSDDSNENSGKEEKSAGKDTDK